MKLITSDSNGQPMQHTGLTARQQQLLNKFNAITEDGKRYIMDVLDDEFRHSPRASASHLRLIVGGAV
ncbi:MAG TPA: hypothetical protein VFK88_05270 [Gallionella sp.]|nr:hypothetical protein [Gallionella sp.]